MVRVLPSLIPSFTIFWNHFGPIRSCKNSTEFLCTFHPTLPMTTSYVTVVHYLTQEIDIGTIHIDYLYIGFNPLKWWLWALLTELWIKSSKIEVLWFYKFICPFSSCTQNLTFCAYKSHLLNQIISSLVQVTCSCVSFTVGNILFEFRMGYSLIFCKETLVFGDCLIKSPRVVTTVCSWYVDCLWLWSNITEEGSLWSKMEIIEKGIRWIWFDSKWWGVCIVQCEELLVCMNC